jgi:heat shock protein HslJ
MRKFLLFALLVILAVACGSGTESDPSGRTWQLTELEGSGLVEGTTIDLTIDGGTVSGSSGCNTYTGAAEVDTDAETMTLGPELASTMMACEQPIMDQEQAYLEALIRVTSYQMAEDQLLLEDADGIVLATFD